MNHLLAVPVLLPLLTGATVVLSSWAPIRLHRVISIGSTALLLAISTALLWQSADGVIQVYRIGAWPAPYGIVLVLDRFAGLMLVLTGVVALCSLLYVITGADFPGRGFHALFQFQLAGLNGAFLTGDLFNLFVFFEILLLASYGLLLHRGDETDSSDSRQNRQRTRAAMHYAVLNLVGSSIFLIAIAVIYATLGTLNMADLALKITGASDQTARLLQIGELLLFAVFALKAAIFPLHLWLAEAYSSAIAPVAALFSVMTKVGLYAIIRLYFLVFSGGREPLPGLVKPWLIGLALVTFVVGSVGVFSARRLRTLVTYLILISVGTVLAGAGLLSEQGLAGALFYLIHTILISAGLFLLADVVALQRQDARDWIHPGPAVSQGGLVGALFLIGAVAIVGLPPLSGVIGKLIILKAAFYEPFGYWVWLVVLGGSFLGLVALSRAGSTLFWKSCAKPRQLAPDGNLLRLSATASLLGAAPLLVVFAGPITRFASAAAQQLLVPERYIEAVLLEEQHG